MAELWDNRQPPVGSFGRVLGSVRTFVASFRLPRWIELIENGKLFFAKVPKEFVNSPLSGTNNLTNSLIVGEVAASIVITSDTLETLRVSSPPDEITEAFVTCFLACIIMGCAFAQKIRKRTFSALCFWFYGIFRGAKSLIYMQRGIPDKQLKIRLLILELILESFLLAGGWKNEKSKYALVIIFIAAIGAGLGLADELSDNPGLHIAYMVFRFIDAFLLLINAFNATLKSQTQEINLKFIDI